jgi:hypothetical protein
MDKVDLEGYQFFASPSDRALMSEILARLAAVEEENRQIKTALSEKDDEIAALREEIALERAYDRRRIARLEEPAPALSQKAARDHLDRLFSEMRRLSIRQTSTKDAARRRIFGNRICFSIPPLRRKVEPRAPDVVLAVDPASPPLGPFAISQADPLGPLLKLSVREPFDPRRKPAAVIWCCGPHLSSPST